MAKNNKQKASGVNEKKKILWVDDHPEEIRAVLREAYQDKYDLIEALNYAAAATIVQADKSLELVLLDIHFDGTQKQGPDIAQDLYDINNNLKFIVLTSFDGDGREISLGDAGAKIAHVLKIELPNLKQFIFNVSAAVLEDYENANWDFEWNISSGLRVKNTVLGIDKLVVFTGFNGQLLDLCINSGIKCFDKGALRTALPPKSTSLEKLTTHINSRLREQTYGKLWGIFVKSGDAKAAIRLVAPNLKSVSGTISAAVLTQPGKSSAASASVPVSGANMTVQSALEKRVKVCETKIAQLMKMLGGRKKK